MLLLINMIANDSQNRKFGTLVLTNQMNIALISNPMGLSTPSSQFYLLTRVLEDQASRTRGIDACMKSELHPDHT
jgi:hypothetical protein